LNEESKHIDLLIARYISGEVSEAEKLELEHWMRNNEANKKYFDGIAFADKQAVSSHKIVKVNVDKAWSSVHQKMSETKQQTTQTVKIRTLPLWARFAAAFVVITALSFFFIMQIEKNNSTNWADTFAAVDSVSSHVLTDSSKVTLNENTRLQVAKAYGKKERRLELAGEAFFEVEPNSEKPFIVETGNALIKVTGTSFNIKNFDADSLVEVYVKTGSVLFFTPENEGITLMAGETGIYNKKNGVFSKTQQSEPNTTAYANRVFVFYNTSLKELFRQISKVYGAEILFDKPEIAACTITV
jgi:ferric-dicitrate binding protein FerR (iron transport regulator)